MALSLMLRGVSKTQGYSHLLRSGSIFKNSPNISFISNRASFNAVNKLVVNDKPNALITSPVRSMSSSSDHRLLWTIEKVFSVALIGIVPLMIAVPNEVLDNVGSIICVLHFHWGLEAIASDYVRPIIFGNVIPTVAVVTVYVISAITLGGLLYFNYTDIGVGRAIRKFWAIKN